MVMVWPYAAHMGFNFGMLTTPNFYFYLPIRRWITDAGDLGLDTVSTYSMTLLARKYMNLVFIKEAYPRKSLNLFVRTIRPVQLFRSALKLICRGTCEYITCEYKK